MKIHVSRLQSRLITSVGNPYPPLTPLCAQPRSKGQRFRLCQQKSSCRMTSKKTPWRKSQRFSPVAGEKSDKTTWKEWHFLIVSIFVDFPMRHSILVSYWARNEELIGYYAPFMKVWHRGKQTYINSNVLTWTVSYHRDIFGYTIPSLKSSVIWWYLKISVLQQRYPSSFFSFSLSAK